MRPNPNKIGPPARALSPSGFGGAKAELRADMSSAQNAPRRSKALTHPVPSVLIQPKNAKTANPRPNINVDALIICITPFLSFQRSN
jgi:hypothetical protein